MHGGSSAFRRGGSPIGYTVAMSEETSAENRKPEPQITPDKPGDAPGPGADQDETDQLPDTMNEPATDAG